MARHATLWVLAGAYKGGRRSLAVTLSHTVDLDVAGHVALCGQGNMADEYSASPEEQAAPPTCPTCKRRDPRFKALSADAFLVTAIEDAARHGRDSDPDHEVGDLQALARLLWEAVPAPERQRIAAAWHAWDADPPDSEPITPTRTRGPRLRR